MIFLFLFIITLFIVIILFSSHKLSPIPYFPTNKRDIPLIIKSFNLKNNQIIYDLGAGDGSVIFATAKQAQQKKLNTQFVAVEINPVLILILNIRHLFHPNKKNIKIVWADMFKIDLKSKISNLIIFLYISPWFLEKVIKNLKLKIKKFSVISYMYPIKSLKKFETIKKGYAHDIFIYTDF